MKTDSYMRGMWPTIIAVTIAIFVFQIIFHKDRVFDHCICEDGSISYSDGSGICSWHGGIQEKIYREIETTYSFQDIGVMFIITAIAGPLVGMGLFILVGMFIKKE